MAATENNINIKCSKEVLFDLLAWHKIEVVDISENTEIPEGVYELHYLNENDIPSMVYVKPDQSFLN